MPDLDLEEQLDALEAQGVPDSWVDGFKSLRKEVAAMNKATKPLREAFNGVPEGDRDVILDFVKVYRQDPLKGAEWAVSVAKDLAKDKYDELAGTTPVQVEETEEPPPTEETSTDMTPEEFTAQVNKAIAEGISSFKAELAADRAAEQEQEKASSAIRTKLEALGYKDPLSARAKVLLLEAQALGGDPLEAIDKAFESLDVALKPVGADAPPASTPGLSADAGSSPPAAPMGSPEGTPRETDHVSTISDGHSAAAQRISDLLGAAPGFDS